VKLKENLGKPGKVILTLFWGSQEIEYLNDKNYNHMTIGFVRNTDCGKGKIPYTWGKFFQVNREKLCQNLGYTVCYFWLP
jgi:hypothetical protein